MWPLTPFQTKDLLSRICRPTWKPGTTLGTGSWSVYAFIDKTIHEIGITNHDAVAAEIFLSERVGYPLGSDAGTRRTMLVEQWPG